jgi:hypothetical protein
MKKLKLSVEMGQVHTEVRVMLLGLVNDSVGEYCFLLAAFLDGDRHVKGDAVLFVPSFGEVRDEELELDVLFGTVAFGHIWALE